MRIRTLCVTGCWRERISDCETNILFLRHYPKNDWLILESETRFGLFQHSKSAHESSYSNIHNPSPSRKHNSIPSLFVFSVRCTLKFQSFPKTYFQCFVQHLSKCLPVSKLSSIQPTRNPPMTFGGSQSAVEVETKICSIMVDRCRNTILSLAPTRAHTRCNATQPIRTTPRLAGLGIATRLRCVFASLRHLARASTFAELSSLFAIFKVSL